MTDDRSLGGARLSRRLCAIALFALAFLAATPAARAAGGGAWTGTWAASPQPPTPGGVARYDNQTLRLIVHTSLGGRKVRIQVSNRYGDAPLTVGAAHVARRLSDADIVPQSDRTLSFRGRPTLRLLPHESVTSDPVDLDVPARGDLAVSLYLPGPTRIDSTHILAKQTSYVSAVGDQTGTATFPAAKKIRSWPLLARVDVAGGPSAGALVAFGDSLVDGDGSSTDRNARWTDDLAARFQSVGLNVGVLNAGLIGNRLLRGSPGADYPDIGPAFGPAGLQRVNGDALDLAGVRWIVLRIGTNDLADPGALSPTSETVTADDLILGLRRLTALAHRRRVKVVGATIPPFEGAAIVPGMWSSEKEATRLKVNDAIRGDRTYDAIIDFDQLLRDPDHPSRLDPHLDSGDHIHANDEGYRRLADAFPLGLVSTTPSHGGFHAGHP
jgi:lysophospholipase L1-like esterase